MALPFSAHRTYTTTTITTITTAEATTTTLIYKILLFVPKQPLQQ